MTYERSLFLGRAGLILLIVLAVTFAFVYAESDYNPKYEADRQFRTALNGEIFTGNEKKDQAEIERLMELPRYSKTFPTGELAQTNWIYVDPALEYAVEHDWRKAFKTKGKVIFNRIAKKK